MLGIRKSKTTPYHPQGDPQPERFNHTLLSMLSTLDPAHKSQRVEWAEQEPFTEITCYPSETRISNQRPISPQQDVEPETVPPVVVPELFQECEENQDLSEHGSQEVLNLHPDVEGNLSLDLYPLMNLDQQCVVNLREKAVQDEEGLQRCMVPSNGPMPPVCSCRPLPYW
ncbi:hypothetical protein QQF64_003383 [Cirrhinus molitorella]|uniref:Integrase catalytic domain-containing protein n=1 Tax=Cirrhinus molitorella TaxID=172907 RepID=A0ABR3ML67_9TELE